MKLRSQKNAGLLGAVSAVVLVLSMFLDWYRLDLPSHLGGRSINVPTYNAFEILERSDVYLVIAAALAVLFGALLFAGVWSDSPAPAVLLVVSSLFALAVVIYRGTTRPQKLVFGGTVDTTLRIGWFIALLAAAAMTLAAVLAYLAGPRLQLEPDEFEEEPEDAEEAAEPPRVEEPEAQETPEHRRES